MGNPTLTALQKQKNAAPKLLKAPFVCNGCPKRNHSNCHFSRRSYQAKTAQKEYETVLVESREGIPLTKEEFYKNEQVISSAVQSGQNIYHAIQTNNLAVSKTTVYRHIEYGYYTISKIDLPRAAKFMPRKEVKGEYVPKGVKVGRSFEDFLRYLEENPTTNYVEMDTLIGRIGGKLIMTFHFVNVTSCSEFFLTAKLRHRQLKRSARLQYLGLRFGETFPILLTNNGGEFSNVSAFENDLNGEAETKMFFCDPNAPYQKPHIENNHTLFRGIVETGTSFDFFTQENINLIFSHINAVKRKQFNGKSAYGMFTFTYSEHHAKAVRISFIPPKDVIQTSKLLNLFS